ncbi:type VI secretion system protein TssA [Fodinicurvata sp. EGI_FJ10296]|uniref:type VI secretion system protein TssA n=1 Tax=Fodinicurvata sp. EGI_FJ10296 TaxID=3231908 RepID=UPI003453B946
MATEPVIDIESLVLPIDGDSPTGSDIRQDVSPQSVYYQLKDARSAARAAERSADADSEEGGLLPEWRAILELAPNVLTTQAKDLEVAAWYIEALARGYGFAGLRDGFELSRRLVEEFWDGLYPEPDEDGIETKVAPFSGLNGEGGDGTLIQPIRKILLSDGEVPFAAWQYEQALEISKIVDEEKRTRRVEGGAMTMDGIEASVRETPPTFFRDLLDDIQAAIDAFKALADAFDAAAGPDAPPTSNIRNLMQSVQGIAASVSRDRLPAADSGAGEAAADAAAGDGAAASGGSAGAGVAQGGGTAVPTGAVQSREQAFQVLAKIADYFRTNEPHSPISYSLDDLVRRGRMSFPDLLAELMDDADARRRLLTSAGIKPPQDEEGY